MVAIDDDYYYYVKELVMTMRIIMMIVIVMMIDDDDDNVDSNDYGDYDNDDNLTLLFRKKSIAVKKNKLHERLLLIPIKTKASLKIYSKPNTNPL